MTEKDANKGVQRLIKQLLCMPKWNNFNLNKWSEIIDKEIWLARIISSARWDIFLGGGRYCKSTRREIGEKILADYALQTWIKKKSKSWKYLQCIEIFKHRCRWGARWNSGETPALQASYVAASLTSIPAFSGWNAYCFMLHKIHGRINSLPYSIEYKPGLLFCLEDKLCGFYSTK